jgi:hypothetical protein
MKDERPTSALHTAPKNGRVKAHHVEQISKEQDKMLKIALVIPLLTFLTGEVHDLPSLQQ